MRCRRLAAVYRVAECRRTPCGATPHPPRIPRHLCPSALHSFAIACACSALQTPVRRKSIGGTAQAVTDEEFFNRDCIADVLSKSTSSTASEDPQSSQAHFGEPRAVPLLLLEKAVIPPLRRVGAVLRQDRNFGERRANTVRPYGAMWARQRP